MDSTNNQSRTFSQDLNAVFGMDKPLAELSQKVEAKKRDVDHQSEELAAIESRLRETEARLAHVTGTAELPPATDGANHTSAAAAAGPDIPAPPPAAMTTGARQVNAKQPPMPRQDSLGTPHVPGALPNTPSEQRGADYVATRQGS